MQHLFKSASVKLTGWYLLLIMLISLLFSLVIYAISSSEFERRIPREGFIVRGFFVDDTVLEAIQQQRAADARRSLITNLTILNVVTLAAGGAASYGLARRTLRPIEQAAEAQGRFIGDASHELRTPLAAMKSEIEVALRGTKPSATQLRDLANSNLEEVNKLQELTDRLLLLSNGGQLEMSNVDIEDLLLGVAARYVSVAEQNNVLLKNEINPTSAHAHFESLRDAVGILLDNAIKYSGSGTEVTLKSGVTNKNVFISIEDNGAGISQADMPYIFDRFYRADRSRTSQTVPGHGLGLSIAKRVVEMHHGNIDVSSVQGRGTTFTIKLPI